MYEVVSSFHPQAQEDDYMAITCPFEKYIPDKDEMDPCIGHIYFTDECLGAGLVSHELLHAALNVERRFHDNPNCILDDEIGEKEERVAYLLTHFVDQFIELID